MAGSGKLRAKKTPQEKLAGERKMKRNAIATDAILRDSPGSGLGNFSQR